MLTIGVDIAQAPLEAAAWHRGQAIRLGSFTHTSTGWAALRDAIVAQLEAPVPPEPPAGTERTESVAVVRQPRGGYELAFALWAGQQPAWQVSRPHAARVRAWARSQGPQPGPAARATEPNPTARMRSA